MSTDAILTPSPAPTLMGEVRNLASLGFPIVISLAAATLIGVVDTIMISPLGTVPLAAASVTTSALIIFYSALYGFISVVGVRMAEAQGRNSPADLSIATRTGILLATIVGTLGAMLMLASKPAVAWIGQPPEVVSALGGYWISMSLMLIPFTLFYALKGLFDALDKPWIGVGLAFLAVILNVPANLLLIHGVGTWDGFGLLGAGLASLLSEGVSLLLAWIIWRRATFATASREPVHITREETILQIREGSAISIGYVGEGGAYSVASLMMGWFSAAALAANQIVASVGSVLYMVPMGISIAVSIRVGQAIGGGKQDRLTRIGLAAFLVIVSWMTLVMIAVLLGRAPISAALSHDPEVIAIATSLFVVIALMQVADGVQGTMLGAARGMTDNHIPVAITLFSYWIVALPAAYVIGFVWDFGPNGIWYGYAAGLVLAATAITWRYFIKAREMAASL